METAEVDKTVTIRAEFPLKFDAMAAAPTARTYWGAKTP